MTKNIFITILVVVITIMTAGCGQKEHIHKYTKATCTKAAVCECGEQDEEARGHELVNGTCSVCGKTPKYEVGNFVILGDSYSAFEGSIPSTYASHYPKEYLDNEKQMWWSIFADNTKATLLHNESYSGAPISYTGYSGGNAYSVSFIQRFEKLVNAGFFDNNVVDTIIIFGGTNDDWAGVPMGEVMYADWTVSDRCFFLPAFCYLLDRVQTQLPDTEIVCVINGVGMSEEYIAGMEEVCKHYEVSYVKLTEIKMQGNHPTSEGMIEIERQIRRIFEKE